MDTVEKKLKEKLRLYPGMRESVFSLAESLSKYGKPKSVWVKRALKKYEFHERQGVREPYIGLWFNLYILKLRKRLYFKQHGKPK